MNERDDSHSIAEARKWLLKGVELEEPEAQYEFAYILYFEDSNTKKAELYFCKSSDQGFLPAQEFLGNLLLFEEGRTKEELAERYSLLMNSAEGGHIASIRDVGLAYVFGKHVEQNFEYARKWLQKAAEYDGSEGQYRLAWVLTYLDETGNREQVLFWLQRAAQQGHEDASEAYGPTTSNTDFNW